MMWYAPRRPGSVWTRNNKQRVAGLEEAGRMQPAGAAAVEAAKASGMWTLMDDVEDLVVPDDLAAALGALPSAREQWDGFPPSARKNALAWIVMAKREETRAARITDVGQRRPGASATAPATVPASCRAMVPRRATMVTPKPITNAARTPMLAKAQSPSLPPSPSGPSR